MKYSIRNLKPTEYEKLQDFLYEAIFIPAGVKAPPKTIINQPELQSYINDFGNKNDYALVVEVDDNIVGAVWTRIMNDYGNIDDETPSLAISLYKEYRGLGMGNQLLKQMLTDLKKQGYKKVSLSVQQANYAVKMYQKFGFHIVSSHDQDSIMVCNL